MKKKIFNALKIILFFSVGIVLIYLSIKDLSQVEREHIMDSFKKANYLWVVLAILLGILSHISRSMRWIMLLETMGYKPKTSNTFYAVMIGYLFNMAFPRLGEVSRCGILNKYEKVPFNKALGTVITERIFDLVTFVLLFLVTIWISYSRVINYLNDNVFPNLKNSLPILTKLLWVGIIGLIALVVFMFFFHKKLTRYSFYNKLFNLLKGFADGLKSLVKVKRPWLFILHSLFIWTMYFLMTYLCFFCFPETAQLSPQAGLVALTIGSIAIMVTPGGIGLYPLVIKGVIQLFGVDSTTGFALGWVTWSAQTFMIIILGAFSLIFLYLSNEVKKKKNQIPQE